MSIRKEQCRKVCRILDDVLANRPTERDALCVAVDKAFEALIQSEQQRTGKWIPQDHNKRVGNISTCVYYYPICSKCGKVGIETYKYCPHCGAKMTEGDAE